MDTWSHAPSEGETFEVHAEVISIGGALILTVCLVLTALSLLALQATRFVSLPFAFVFSLTLASWVYYLNAVTERVRLADHAIEYRSALTRRRVSLDDLEGMTLLHQGFNLERGIETIEFRKKSGARDQIALGPCWQKRKLTAFLQSVARTLQEDRALGIVIEM